MEGTRRAGQKLRWEDVLAAYTIGMFPMADPADGAISWYAPDPRGIIDLQACTPSRSLRRTIRSGIFEVRWNTAFREVMEACADREETWISGEILDAYTELHARGFAHSVEAWSGDMLAGGLYGVSVGGGFFGESMFSRKTDASKVTLIALAERMKLRGFTLLDAQFVTPHLRQFGGTSIPRREYMKRLKQAVHLTCTIHP